MTSPLRGIDDGGGGGSRLRWRARRRWAVGDKQLEIGSDQKEIHFHALNRLRSIGSSMYFDNMQIDDPVVIPSAVVMRQCDMRASTCSLIQSV